VTISKIYAAGNAQRSHLREREQSWAQLSSRRATFATAILQIKDGALD